VHDGDDRREHEDDQPDRPSATASGPSTDRVRIVGAEQAGDATAVVPAVPASVTPVEPVDGDTSDSAVRLIDVPGYTGPEGNAVQPVLPGETAVPAGTAPPTELPHWTEEPTGQVPSVLTRDGDGETGGRSTISAPTWREEHSDWVAHEEEFEPAMFGADETALGSLDETDDGESDRRPWEFDLPSAAGAAEPGGPRSRITGHEAGGPPGPSELGRLGSGRPRGVEIDGDLDRERSGFVDGETETGEVDPTVIGPVDEALPGSGRSQPTGTTRIGRARRSGPRNARIRAKRPGDADALTDSPLAAELPGAAVTEVPGVGLRRGGVAGLAAADRSAERLDEQTRYDAGNSEEADEEADRMGGSLEPSETSRRRRGSPPPRSASRSRIDAANQPDDDRLGGGPPIPRRVRPSNGDRSRARGAGASEGTGAIRIRIATGIAVAVIALVAFSLGTVTSLVLCIVVVAFAAGECFGVLRSAGYHPATLLGLVGTISLMVGAYAKGPAALPLVMVLIAVFTLLWYLFGIERGAPVAGAAATLLTVGWISLLGSYAGLLLSPSAHPHREGIAFLLGAIIATVANDVGAFVVGGWVGRHPLAPTVSPKKTWEGFLGGAGLSVVVSAAVVGAIHPWTPGRAAALGLVVAVVAPIGDLCESLLKRDLRVKDMGNLLPGHGGVLDRIDGLLVVLPATYYLVRALNIG
jgi:CDP-diglyceride synthetase